MHAQYIFSWQVVQELSKRAHSSFNNIFFAISGLLDGACYKLVYKIIHLIAMINNSVLNWRIKYINLSEWKSCLKSCFLLYIYIYLLIFLTRKSEKSLRDRMETKVRFTCKQFEMTLHCKCKFLIRKWVKGILSHFIEIEFWLTCRMTRIHFFF